MQERDRQATGRHQRVVELPQAEGFAKLALPLREQRLHLQHAGGVAESVAGRPPQVDFSVDAGDVAIEVRDVFDPEVGNLVGGHDIELQPDIGRHSGCPKNAKEIDQFPHARICIKQARVHHCFL